MTENKFIPVFASLSIDFRKSLNDLGRIISYSDPWRYSYIKIINIIRRLSSYNSFGTRDTSHTI